MIICILCTKSGSEGKKSHLKDEVAKYTTLNIRIQVHCILYATRIYSSPSDLMVLSMSASRSGDGFLKPFI